MRRILVVSSHVAFDPVGLAATILPLQRAGIEVVALPTVVLSNHPARPRVAGVTLEPTLLDGMVRTIEANGWLATFDAVLSGYLPSAAHVAGLREAVKRMRGVNPRLLYICDPIFGDDPQGLYLEASAADAIRELLLPMADAVTPNRFELARLAGIEVRSVDDAVRAALLLGRPQIAATSIPDGAARVANVIVAGGQMFIGKVDRLDDVPHGTGDLFAGLLTAKLLDGALPAAALGYAVGGVKHAVDVSRGSDRLLLALMDWSNGIIPAHINRLA
jgi:pyridoxine kinase